MAQLRTYSRKARPIEPLDSTYKSSQESFFDSPDDPYFFDSQHSTLERSQPSVSSQATLLSTSPNVSTKAALSSQSQSHNHLVNVLPANSAVSTQTAAQPRVKAKGLPANAPALQSQQAHARPLSRLSQSSSQPAARKPASLLPAKQKRILTAPNLLEGPATKKACLKRSSGSSVNQTRTSSSRSGKDKPNSAPATTVLEVIAILTCQQACPEISSICMLKEIPSTAPRHKKAGSTHKLWMT